MTTEKIIALVLFCAVISFYYVYFNIKIKNIKNKLKDKIYKLECDVVNNKINTNEYIHKQIDRVYEDYLYIQKRIDTIEDTLNDDEHIHINRCDVCGRFTKNDNVCDKCIEKQNNENVDNDINCK